MNDGSARPMHRRAPPKDIYFPLQAPSPLGAGAQSLHRFSSMRSRLLLDISFRLARTSSAGGSAPRLAQDLFRRPGLGLIMPK